MTCARCGKELTRDETGLSRKLISRATTIFFCIDCLAAEYRISAAQLREMIEHFRQAGCTLFL